MNMKTEWKPLFLIIAIFLGCYYLPVGTQRFDNAVIESFHLVKWYAQEHVLLCLVPAFFIAGAIGAFVSQASVMKYLGPKANKGIAYSVASVSGAILAVCSCTILPLFAGISKMWCRPGASLHVFVFRSGHQRSCHNYDSQNPWHRAGNCPRRLCNCLQRYHWSHHAPSL